LEGEEVSMRYEFVIKEQVHFELFRGELVPNTSIFLCIRDNNNGCIYPHPLSNYIKGKYVNNTASISSQKNAGEEIKKFLNYVLERINNNDEDFIGLRHSGLKGLGKMHASSYISYQTDKARMGEIKGSYVFRMEQYLIEFYEWLREETIIEEEFIVIKSPVTNSKGKILYTKKVSPFKSSEFETKYPNKRVNQEPEKLVDFGENRADLVVRFLSISQRLVPEITLGIAFQFFAGLRKGEVVNLTRESLEVVGNEGLQIQVRDNRDKLFPNKKNTMHEQVKHPRNQSVLISELLVKFQQNHLNRLKKMEDSGQIKNSHALFVNTKGVAVSGRAYWDKFNKVKKVFLQEISEMGNVDDFTFLVSKPWSTHIGRGVFTNFCLQVGMTVIELALARGDKDINSALKYVEKQTAIQNIKKANETIRKAYLEQKASIDSDKISKFKENIKVM
jgi:hypothetical protein